MKRTIVVVVVAVSVAMSSMAVAEAAPEADVVKFPTGQACAVLSLAETVCFDSEAEMEAATSSLTDDTLVTTSSTYCAGRSDLWLYLYEHSNYGGRTLKFRDADLWQNLTWWDFNDQMSSYKNNTLCTVYIAEHIDGGGSWLIVSALSSSSWVGSTWDNRASSFYIDA
ncbi:MAG: peptidase inhibitor family I36 protein [Actinobacteria bacterium]|nr:peptidase inhibitor family I36 protein [Actinomycetota bacterium]